jgi:Xaa-Pro aminopeptidase
MSDARVARLEALFEEAELDALLVTHLVNVRYLSGFGGTNGICAVGAGVRAFFTDFRYTERAGREVGGLDVDPEDRELGKGALKRLSEAGARRVGFEDGHVSVRQLGKLREAAPDGVELEPAGDLVERLRAVKDDSELAAIRSAASAVTGIYEHLRGLDPAGRSERDIARELEAEMRARGVEPAFPTIVAAGPNAARPHHDPGDDEIRSGTAVIVDMGCVVDGYRSDCTRTLAVGELDGEAREVYELVLEAQQTALGRVAPGVGCKDLDAVARELIESAGHGERFGHGLGHGVGLEVHEEPTLSQRSEGELVSGNVVTVEPGVYLPGRLGVRIEDLVAVGADGPEILTSFPKSPVSFG